jgi:hypothetical protein
LCLRFMCRLLTGAASVQWRFATPCRLYSVASQRCSADPFTDKSGIPGSDPSLASIVNGKKIVSPKIIKLADDIVGLSLLETVDLCDQLKVGGGVVGGSQGEQGASALM